MSPSRGDTRSSSSRSASSSSIAGAGPATCSSAMARLSRMTGLGFSRSERAIEREDLRPVGVLEGRRLGVARRDRRLQPVGAGPAEPPRLLEECAGLGDGRVIPTGPVLVAEEHECPAAAETGVAPRLVQLHERQQRDDLGLLRQQPGDETAEPERVGAQVSAGRAIGTAAQVALVEHDVERREHLGKPVRQLVRVGHPVRDVRVDDLALGAHDPLRHGRLGDEEGIRDLAGGHAHDGAQRQRDLCVARDRGMTAREDAAAGGRRGPGAPPVPSRRSATGASLRYAVSRRRRSMARRRAVWRSQAAGRSGTPSTGQLLQRDDDRILDEVLGEVEVAGHADERAADQGDLVAEDRVDRVARSGRSPPHSSVQRTDQPTGWFGMSSRAR